MPKTKFRKWLEAIGDIRGWNINEMLYDDTYNYEHFYNARPKEAAAMLKKNAEAHFADVAKTAKHPTFSNLSDYSGKFNAIHNPFSIVGGNWNDEPALGRNASRYTLSNSQLRNNWDIYDTINYMSEAEDNGASIRLPNGQMPYIDNAYFAGILPNIIVRPNRRTNKRR